MKPDLFQFQGTPAEVVTSWQGLERVVRADANAFGHTYLIPGSVVLFLLPFLPHQFLALWPCFLAGGAALCVIGPRMVGRLVVDKAKLLVARVLVDMLKDESLPTEGQVRLNVDFRDYASEEFQTASRGDGQTQAAPRKTLLESMDSPLGGVWTKPYLVAYQQKWLEFHGHFGDGTRFQLEVLRHAERRVHSKTTGRIGLPFEDEVHEEVTLVLHVRGEAPEDVASRLDIDLPAGLTGKAPEVQGDAVHIVLFTPGVRRAGGKDLAFGDLVQPGDLMALLLDTSRKIQRARR